MRYEDVTALIESIGLPYAYYQFIDKTDQAPPFVCFFFDDSNDFVADNQNYKKIKRLVIELYTDMKDGPEAMTKLQEKIEGILTGAGFVYGQDFTPLDDEGMYESIYTMEVLIDG